MLNLTRPRYVMPVHGDFKRMLIHAPARRGGRRADGEHLPHRERHAAGDRRRRRAASARRSTAGMIFVDGVDIGDVADVALRDRRMLSADGIFIVVATVSEQDGSSVVPPEVLARGVPFLDGNGGLRRRAARGGRGLAGPRGRAAHHRDRRAGELPARRPGDVHLRPAQAPSRWCCRSSSRSDAPRARAGPQAPRPSRTSSMIPDAGDRVGRARRAERDDQRRRAGSRRPASPRRSTPAGRPCAPGTPAAWPPAARSSPPPTGCRCRRRRRPTSGTPRSSVCALRHARGRRARRRRWRSGSGRTRSGSSAPGTAGCRARCRRPRRPAGCRSRRSSSEALLRVDDLDRDDEREADQRQRLADQQRAHEPMSAREGEPVAEARRASAGAVGVLERGQAGGGAEHGGDHQERGGVDRAARPRPRTPRSAGRRARRRPTEETAKPRFISALPSPISPCGCSTAATAPRVSPRPVIASVPSTSPSASTAASTKRSPSAQERERRECGRLEHVDRRQRAAQRQPVQVRGQPGGEQRGQELGGQEEPGGRRDGVRAVEDEHGQRDEPDRVAEVVDRVGPEQPPEWPDAQGFETPPHHGAL